MVTPFCEMKEFIVSALGLEFCFLCFTASGHSYYGSPHSSSRVLLLLFICEEFIPYKPVGWLREKLVLATGSLSNAPDFS